MGFIKFENESFLNSERESATLHQPKYLMQSWRKLRLTQFLICNSLGFVSGSWILLSLIDFHLSARVDDFLVPRSVQFLWTLQLVKMCGIFAVFGLPENSSKFRNEILRYIFDKSKQFDKKIDRHHIIFLGKLVGFISYI